MADGNPSILSAIGAKLASALAASGRSFYNDYVNYRGSIELHQEINSRKALFFKNIFPDISHFIKPCPSLKKTCR
jgi:hypothetical protein